MPCVGGGMEQSRSAFALPHNEPLGVTKRIDSGAQRTMDFAARRLMRGFRGLPDNAFDHFAYARDAGPMTPDAVGRCGLRGHRVGQSVINVAGDDGCTRRGW